MNPGQQVRCINDDFSAPCFAGYRQFPVEGAVYTIREVRLAHTRQRQPVLLLVGLSNPRQAIGRKTSFDNILWSSTSQETVEPGFGAWRFRPATDISNLLPSEIVKEDA